MIWDDLLPLTAIEYVIWRMMINYWTWGYKRFWTVTKPLQPSKAHLQHFSHPQMLASN